jgi:hypothetical protein
MTGIYKHKAMCQLCPRYPYKCHRTRTNLGTLSLVSSWNRYVMIVPIFGGALRCLSDNPVLTLNFFLDSVSHFSTPVKTARPLHWGVSRKTSFSVVECLYESLQILVRHRVLYIISTYLYHEQVRRTMTFIYSGIKQNTRISSCIRQSKPKRNGRTIMAS